MTNKKALDTLRAFGLTYPETHIKSPWENHADLAVNDKTFAYLPVDDAVFTISCKLKNTSEEALLLPFSTPTAYGLGRWSWVTATISDGDIPLDLFKEWIDESYRSQAPKKLLKLLD